MSLNRVWGRTTRWASDSATVHRWREARYRLFLERCAVKPGDRILDVGAGSGGALERFNQANEIVALDISPQHAVWFDRDGVTVVEGDATRLLFADDEFDVVFSNSVIEHIPQSLQKTFADEVARVGRRYFVQTPNRYFPIEPHYQFPFFQFLPTRVQKLVNSRLRLGWRTKGSWEDINLLTARDLRVLFPDATIEREKLFGLTKSLMVISPTTAPQNGS